MAITFTPAGMRRGARQGVPLLLGIAPFGVVVGVIALGRGLGLAETVLMSAVVFAGASQLLALELWANPPDILAVALAALVVNVRMVPMGAAMGFWLDALRGWRLWGSLFLLVDHSFALSVAANRAGERDAGFLLGLGVVTWVGWVVATAAGHVLGSVVVLPPEHPIYFAAPASFIAILVALWRGPRRDLPPWLVAAAVALGVQALRLPAPFPLLAGAFAGAGLAAWREMRGGPGAGTAARGAAPKASAPPPPGVAQGAGQGAAPGAAQGADHGADQGSHGAPGAGLAGGPAR